MFSIFGTFKRHWDNLSKATVVPGRDAIVFSYLTMACFGLLWLFTCSMVWRQGEMRDWTFYAIVLVFLPFLLWKVSEGFGRRTLFTLAFVYFVVFFSVGSASFGDELYAKIGFALGQDLHPGFRNGLAIALKQVGIALNVALFYLCMRWLAAKSELPGRDIWLVLPLVLWTFFVNERERPLFWFQQRYVIDYLVLFLLVCYFRKRFWHATPRKAPRRFDWVDVVWVCVSALFLVFPLSSEGGFLMHHWGYYIGPIETVKKGGLLLYDTPSQYGFLSILLPALLPFSAANSFWVSLCGVLSLQVALVYAMLRRLPLFGADRFLPGLLTLVFVFLRGGAQAKFLGIYEAPSTSGYRFLWAFALAFLLVSEALAKRAVVRNTALSIIFVVGCLWSAESAVYCVFVLGFAALGLFLERLRGHSQKGSWKNALGLGWFLYPVLSLLVAIGVISSVYRYRFDIAPDWLGFFEYPLAYGGGFGAMNVRLLSSGTAGLFLIMALVFQALWQKARRGSKNVGAFAGFWGFILATFTYFIGRSHPINTLNLLTFWLPILLFLIGGLDNTRADRRYKALVAFLLISMILGSFSNISVFGERLYRLAQLSSLVSMDEALDFPRCKYPVTSVDLGQPLVDLSGRYPELRQIHCAFVPLYPIYPVGEFGILSEERQAVYLERFFSRNSPSGFQVIRKHPDKDGMLRREELSTVPALQKFFVLKETVPLSSTEYLERYVR